MSETNEKKFIMLFLEPFLQISTSEYPSIDVSTPLQQLKRDEQEGMTIRML
jgi:hypothetical protein